MRLTVLILISVLLSACVSYQTRLRLSYEKKRTSLQEIATKQGETPSEESVKKNLSQRLNRAHDSLGCDPKLIKIIAKEDADEAERLELICNYEVGIEQLKQIENSIQATKKQVKTQ